MIYTRSLINLRKFYSNTLDILKKKKLFLTKSSHNSPLPTQPLFTPINKHYLQTQINNQIQQLLPYNSMHQQYLNHFPSSIIASYQLSHPLIIYSIPTIRQLDMNLRANTALISYSGNQQQIDDFGLLKVLHIALWYIEQQKQRQNKAVLWKKIGQRIEYLFRNTSIQENIIILYIIRNKQQYFSSKFTIAVVQMLQQQVRFMNEKQKQLVFYVTSKLKARHLTSSLFQPEDNQINKQLDRLDSSIVTSLNGMKLSVASMYNWLALHSVCRKSSYATISNYFNRCLAQLKNMKSVKANSENQQKKFAMQAMNLQQILYCLQHQRMLGPFYKQQSLRIVAQKVIENYNELISKTGELELRGKTRIKMGLHLQGIGQFSLNNQQIAESKQISASEKLRYVHHLWKYEHKQQYEIKNLYESVKLELIGVPFSNIDQIFHAITLELAINSRINQQKIIEWLEAIDYLPRGIEFYAIAYLMTLQSSQFCKRVRDIMSKFNSNRHKYNKNKTLLKQIKELEQTNISIEELSKFFKSICIWEFSKLLYIANGEYLAHYCWQQHKIILHCLHKQDCLESGPLNEKMVHNEFLLKKQILKQKFGYEMIIVNVQEFLQLNYNDRVSWLGERIRELLKTEKFIEGASNMHQRQELKNNKQ